MSNPRTACGPVEGFVRPTKFFIIVYVQHNSTCHYFYHLNIDIFDAMVFTACWKKLSIPSASRTPTARREPPSINVLAGPDTPPVCGPFQQIPSLHNSWRTGDTRQGTTSLVNKEVSDLWRVPTQRVIVSLAPSRQRRARNISGIRFCFPRVNTSRRISSQILVLLFLHFLHASIQNFQHLEKSTSRYGP